ncbi:hypothetical protein PI125_g624 [Phytophthora idaei]|nr:hypothetical protein PI125_g624 [Phytophthora idaei]
MDCTTSVQTLIDQFELMAQNSAKSAVPRTSSSVTRNTKVALPKTDNSPVKEIINRLNTQHTHTQSELVQIAQEMEEPAGEPIEGEQDIVVAMPATLTKVNVYKCLTVSTLQSNGEDGATILNSYEDESDAESTSTFKHTRYSAGPCSPSTYSTASTSSLDSLLSSLDMFLPELLESSSETSPKIAKIVKPTVYRSRRTSLPKNLQSTKASKLVPPTAYRRSTLTRKPSSTTTKESSSYPIPVARNHSSSSPVSRYMDYDSSPRFAATKAMNVERRRRLEERNRNLAADKVMRSDSRPRTPEWQGRLDQVRSQLFDGKENNQSYAAKAKGTASRRLSTSSYPRV